MLARLKAYVDERTGFVTAVSRFLDEPVPASTGWRNTLGSIAGALLLLQVLSGLLMALYYVPSPADAYDSVKYVEENVVAGSLVRALHHWGASFIIMALLAHTCRTYFSGAYLKPREFNWVLGVLLFAVTTLLAFTGQLLPMSQKAYWAAKVGVEIASSTPVAGPYIGRFLLAGDSLGALTLTRFYTAHIALLPLVLGALVLLHLHLLRRHAPMRAARDGSDAVISFYPQQLFRDLVAISVVFVALFAAALWLGGPVSDPADPTDARYVPTPEWYFLAHYEILKMTPGHLKLFPTVILPGALFAFAILLPWIDRAGHGRARSRRPFLVFGVLGLLSVAGLTVFGVVTTPPETTKTAGVAPFDMAEAGRGIFERENCAACHMIDGVGGKRAPNLSAAGLKIRPEFMRKFVVDPESFLPETIMPGAIVTEVELEQLVAYLQDRVTPPE